MTEGDASMFYIMDGLTAYALCTLGYATVTPRPERITGAEAYHHVRAAMSVGQHVAVLDTVPRAHIELLMERLDVTLVERPTPAHMDEGDTVLLVDILDPETVLGAPTPHRHVIRYPVGQLLRAAGDGDARGPSEHLVPRR